jgi:protein subunit release factor A
MRENIAEVPGGQKPPAGEQDDSLFMKVYQLEKKKIEELSDQIIERLKLLEKEQDPEIRKKTEAEIADLKEKKSEARKSATLAIHDQRWSDEELKNEISTLIH